MATEPKTQKTAASPHAFLKGVQDDERRADAQALLKIMQDVTGERPVMWGPSIVGFGQYHYAYASGREGDWPIVGFSPRKQNLVLYVATGYEDYSSILEQLGPHKKGKACVYIKHLSDIHVPTLKKLITRGYTDMKKKYPTK